MNEQAIGGIIGMLISYALLFAGIAVAYLAWKKHMRAKEGK